MGRDVSLTGPPAARVQAHALPHRADIDGLRAVAVLAIVAFHAGLPQPGILAGGFLGVDVFFVISGFLITSIIDRDARGGSFTLIGFYQRRVARILPALLVMLVATCVVGMVVLLPGELSALATSAAAAAGFGSNIFFWREAAYFGGMAEARPLLHTWSLGVEEQFYLGYPLLLPLALSWLGRVGTTVAMAIAVAASLALCFLYADTNPVPVFYLLPSRLWEIGLGALAALATAGGRTRPAAIPGAGAAWAGLFLIVAALVLARPDAAQGWAVAACAGTALVLVFGAGGTAGAVLSVAPLRWVGRLSYSLYLWHWPVLALFRTVHGQRLDGAETAGLLAVSLILAVLSYRLIEQPFRRRGAQGPAWHVVGAGIGASALAIGGALALRSVDAVRDLPPEVKRIAAYSDYWRKAPVPTPLERHCRVVAPANRPAACPATASGTNVLLIGDSHADHILHALRFRFPAYRIVPVITKGCRSLIGAPPTRCTRRLHEAMRTLVATGRVQAAILAEQWQAEDIGRLVGTIRALRAHGVAVTVIGPVVEYDGDFPRILARAVLRGDPAGVDELRRRARQTLDRRMAIAVRGAGARYFSAHDAECPNGRCRLFSSTGEPMHFDYGHYTRSASVDVIARLPAISDR